MTLTFSSSDRMAIKNFGRLLRRIHTQLGGKDAIVVAEFAGGRFNVAVARPGETTRGFEAAGLWGAIANATSWLRTKRLQGGPGRCPSGPCSECSPPHHFLHECPEFAQDNPTHPAAKAGLEFWTPCKHCDAWIEAE